MKEFVIDNTLLDIEAIYEIIEKDSILKLSDESINNVVECRNYLDKKISQSESPLYGINTGFGSLYNVSIEDKDLSKLQHNLILSHSCGVGEKTPLAIVKIMLLLKIITLSKGHSGIHLDTLNRLIFFYNNDILPVIFKHGSLGASGDLSPLAHLSLPLIGEGQVFYKGILKDASEVLKELSILPLKLRSKEGLALLNGTQFMSGYGIHLLFEAYKISHMADLISSISLEAYDCRVEPFDVLIQKVRPHNGQAIVAARVNHFRDNSDISLMHKVHTQDPYSFRCIPQVHGASLDTICYAKSVIMNEVNSVNDNPIIFHKEDKIISGGNFHGQPLAYVLDFLKISLSELGNISERRTYNLISGQRGLPSFLVDSPGLNSGFMIPQYTAASLVSLNKQLSSPSSVDSIVSSNGQEDHVSMGANSAILLYDITENVKKILSIELFNAAQALDFKKPLKTSKRLNSFIEQYRNHVEFVTEDKIMSKEINNSLAFIDDYKIEDNLFTF
ncbi:MAG: Histidine ammonia-lyase [Flavobacteriaceae bacterium]|nr:MAG: Histidine ammonia-lyase [Flavobacteriaceae bacterium]